MCDGKNCQVVRIRVSNQSRVANTEQEHTPVKSRKFTDGECVSILAAEEMTPTEAWSLLVILFSSVQQLAQPCGTVLAGLVIVLLYYYN